MKTSSRPIAGSGRSSGRPRSATTVDDASTALARIRAELVDLHATMLGLQVAFGPTLAAAAGDAAVVRAAQGLDLVAQSLDGLATFVDALAAAAGRSDRLDVDAAAATVDVGALSSRLAGRSPTTPSNHDQGEVELF